MADYDKRGGRAAEDPAPHRLRGRALAPDLARGFMLLFIALVNAQFFLTGPDTVTSFADRVVALTQLSLVNSRAIPLFSLLFGYGLVQLLRGLEAKNEGWARTRGLFRRRAAWMLAIGFAHGALLLPVDIIGAYGLALLVFVGLVRARDATLLWVSGAVVAASIAFMVTPALLLPPETGGAISAPSLEMRSYALATIARAAEWLIYTPMTLLTIVLPPLLWGVWAARRRILEDPARHRALLTRTAVLGLGVAVAGGLPYALVEAGAELPGRVPAMLGVLHTVTGWAGGLGWAALIALVAVAAERHRGRLTRAVEAVGQRSMTCYLTQSLVFVPLLAPYGLGLGATLSVSGAAFVGTCTWGLTLVLASLLRRWGYRGPAESLVRR
ncbi:putative membrane protein YeiB [Lipingzhangella halophila]|uniref:Putative membrane protein YeiB n=1 Tax=Lipingzhangella halophila TaxID=1783352 RepID=A0A7W7RQ18_9ACTN|nr:DUF418 domain-containing protein [Lipingzhangella halophila]MBB4935543.1 putative membrane protein YeiB [Lipingzhangella halophila]